jgi:hypothetical protein
MERASRRSADGRTEPARRRLRAWTTGGIAAGLTLAALALVAVAPAGATSPRSSAGGALPASRATKCTIQERAAFKPPRVVEGQNAHLVVVLRNCTGSAQSVELTRFGELACLVLDPVAQAITLGANQTAAFDSEYLAPSCAGSGRITARVTNSAGRRLATRTAHLQVLAPPPSS